MVQKKRIIGYDYLRVIAIFMVVVIHGNVAFIANNAPLRLIAMELCALCLISVPCFLMISGALLLESESELPFKALRRRLTKQGLPFIVWSLIYVVVRIMLKKIPASIQAFTSLLYEPAYYQFWFMYTLLAIYLLLPVLSPLVHHISKQVYRYALGVWLLFSVLQPMLGHFFSPFRLSAHMDLVICEGYLGYFLLGYYLKKYGSEITAKKAIWLFLCGCGITSMLLWGEYGLSGADFQGYFYRSYLTPGVVLASIGAFAYFQNRTYRHSFVMVYLSNISIGVFYVHMLVMAMLEYAGFSGADNLLICEIKNIAVYGVSALIAFGISKIPILRKILLGMN